LLEKIADNLFTVFSRRQPPPKQKADKKFSSSLIEKRKWGRAKFKKQKKILLEA